MRKYLVTLLVILTVTVIAMFGIDAVYYTYPTTLRVVEIHYAGDDGGYMVACVPDASYIKYVIKEDPEDILEGDIISVIMYDRGKRESISDDIVLKWRYAGYEF